MKSDHYQAPPRGLEFFLHYAMPAFAAPVSPLLCLVSVGYDFPTRCFLDAIRDPYGFS